MPALRVAPARSPARTTRPTPGTDYYKLPQASSASTPCAIINENPIAAMRLSDPTQSRIHTVNYELTDEERIKAGNNDYQIRGTIGLLWHTIEMLRIMAHGTAAADIAWRQGRDAIEELLVPFCALCDGAGMSYRTIRKHPHKDWHRYQTAACASARIATSTRRRWRTSA